MAAKLGNLIDSLYAADKEIDEALTVVRDLKKKRDRIETNLLNNFDKEELNGAAGKTAKARINRTRHPTIKDRKALLKYILARKAFDLFQNRLSSKAYFDRLEEGEHVPGVEIFTRVSVSVTRRK